MIKTIRTKFKDSDYVTPRDEFTLRNEYEIDFVMSRMSKTKSYDNDQQRHKLLADKLSGKLQKEHIAKWPADQLELFLNEGKFQYPTESGNLPHDLNRSKDPSEWKSSELKDWLNGSICAPPGTLYDHVLDEIYKRYNVNRNYVVQDMISYVLHGVNPGLVSPYGLLKNSRLRDMKGIENYTCVELMAAYVGDIESSFEQNELHEEICYRLNINKEISKRSLLIPYHEGTFKMSNYKEQFDEIFEERTELLRKFGGHVDQATMGRNQHRLIHVLKKVLKLNADEFRDVWLHLLDCAYSNWDCTFAARVRFQGWEAFYASQRDRLMAEQVFQVIDLTRAPKDRFNNQAIKNEIAVCLRYTGDEKLLNRLMGFHYPSGY